MYNYVPDQDENRGGIRLQSGETIEIPNKGYKKNGGERGNLVAEVKIMVPRKLELNEKEAFEKLSQMSNFNPRT